jgi:hypothetical protein
LRNTAKKGGKYPPRSAEISTNWKGGGMIEQFIKDLAFSFDRLKQRHEKMDFPKGLLFYEYPVQCNGKFLHLGVEIESGKFYLEGDGIDGKIQTILL